MTVRLGDAKAMRLLRIHNALTRYALEAYNGREVKHTGDGFMLSFVSASDAVECAIAVQEAFAAYNGEHPAEAMHVRIGLSAGEPVQEDGDLFGVTVQLAARLCAHAEPDHILAAQVVQEQCEKRWPFVSLGEMTPKGFDRPVPLYEVEWRAT
jgi:class 3 adenylate cyclase